MAREGSGEGIVREFGTDTHTLLYLKWITRDFPGSSVVNPLSNAKDVLVGSIPGWGTKIPHAGIESGGIKLI